MSSYVMVFENPSGALAFSIDDGKHLVLPSGRVLPASALPDVWEVSDTGSPDELDIPEELRARVVRVLEEAATYRAKKEKEEREKAAYIATLSLEERLVKGL